MKTNNRCFAVRASLVAVQGALGAFAVVSAAQAAEGDNAARQLTQPTNQVEIGGGYVSQDSFKFGQYNGLFNKGFYGLFNFDVRSADAYDSDSAVRWRVIGTDLGLDTRKITAEVGQQGKFRVNVGFDELRSNRSDTYQTPYLGAGSNNLTLPPGWLVPVVPQVSATSGNFRGLDPITGLAPSLVNGVATPPTSTQQATVNKIIAADVPAFKDVDIGTTRKTYDGGFSYQIDPQWEFKASATHEDKNGTKLMNMLSLANGTASVTLPDLIDQSTDQYNVGLNYTGEKAFLQAAYYGSIFKNHVDSMNWQNPFQPTTVAQMSSAPSNEFHQLTLTGGYHFSPATKLVMFGSYARNTQNDPFLADPGNSPLGLPVSSLNGLVVTKAFNAKLTAKPATGLNLTAAYKYDDHDNRTPVHTYVFYDAGEPKSGISPFNSALGLPAGTLGSNINIYANRPYSKKLNQFNLDADYAVAKGQALKFGYDYQKIDRSCPGSWINCADAPETRESTARAEWRVNVVEDLSGRLSYAYSRRKVDYDENAWLSLVPMANVIPSGGATLSVVDFLNLSGLGGFGPIAPFVPLQTGNLGIFFPNNSSLPQALYGSRNDIHEIIGMRRFAFADRNRDKVRASLNWQASDKLSLQGGLDYNKDDYTHSMFGLKSAESWAVNLDGTFAVSDAITANAFYTYEDLRSRTAGASYSSGAITNTATVGGVAGNTVVSGGCFTTVLDKNENAKIDPCLNWSTDMRDKVDTVGAGVRYKGAMAGRLDLGGDLVFTRARTNNGMTGGTYANNPAAVAGQPAVVPAVIFIPAANLPAVTTNTIELKLTGQYAIDSASAVRLLYWFQRLRSTDYAFDGMQFGTITSVIPTNEQAPNYKVHVVGVSYIYRWQ
jgi:MtrB/PioB family decaheme-associated outer membrane protein